MVSLVVNTILFDCRFCEIRTIFPSDFCQHCIHNDIDRQNISNVVVSIWANIHGVLVLATHVDEPLSGLVTYGNCLVAMYKYPWQRQCEASIELDS